MRVSYKPSFIREFKSLELSLQNEAFEKIELFKEKKNHRTLRVHALRGPLKGYFSFSVSYRYRIVFTYESKDSAILLFIGDHTVYDK